MSEQIDLQWVAGREGGQRILSSETIQKPALALIGHLNFVHPNRVQVLGCAEMDYLRAGINLRAMGQRDPLVEYQREAYDMFAEMVDSLRRDAVRTLFHAQVVEQPAQTAPVVRLQGTGASAVKKQASAKDKVGRNDPCPCGSGQKYKRCHGAVPAAT